MNGSKASIDEIIKFLNEKGVNPKAGKCPETYRYSLLKTFISFRNNSVGRASLIAVIRILLSNEYVTFAS